MRSRCPHCGGLSPSDAHFCIGCGGVLRAAPAQPAPRRSTATGPTIRLPQAEQTATAGSALVRPAFWDGLLVQVVGLIFPVVFVIGLAQLIAIGGLPGVGWWGTVPLIAGALRAQHLWVNRQRWAGFSGMLVWAGAAWLLGFGQPISWAALPAFWWCLLGLHKARRRP